MTSQWPFGMPTATPMYAADRQYHEDAALSLKRSAEDKLTPTGRLRKHIEPARFKDLVERATKALNDLIERYPDHADNYRRWLADLKALTAKAK